MKVPMTATKSLIYAGRRLKAGDEFEASRMDARLLAAIRKASYRTAAVAAAPVQKPVVAAETDPTPSADDITVLRAQYREVVGRQPFHGWDAETLRAKIAAHGSEG